MYFICNKYKYTYTKNNDSVIKKRNTDFVYSFIGGHSEMVAVRSRICLSNNVFVNVSLLQQFSLYSTSRL